MIGFSAGLTAGDLTVNIAHGRGFTPDELADQAMRKLMVVSDSAPPPIRDQAHAFQSRLRAVMVHYLAQAARSERTTLYNKLREAGFPEAADVILKL